MSRETVIDQLLQPLLDDIVVSKSGDTKPIADHIKSTLAEMELQAEIRGGIRALEVAESEGHGGGNWRRIIELGIGMLKAQQKTIVPWKETP